MIRLQRILCVSALSGAGRKVLIDFESSSMSAASDEQRRLTPGDASVGVQFPPDSPEPDAGTDWEERFPPPPAERPLPLGEFLCTVYTFPLRRTSTWRWFLLTIGLAPAFAIPADAIDRTGSWWTAGISLIPLLFCVCWAVLYGAALFLCVTEATAAGANTIEEWPGDDWPEWIDSVVQLAYIITVTGVPSVALVSLIRRTGLNFNPALDEAFLANWSPEFWLATAGVTYFLFPVAMMSSLQARYKWIPLAWPVTRSFFAMETAWLWPLFWMAGMPLVFLASGQLAFVRKGMYAQVGIAMGGQLAASLLIYARLLGRLGWEIGERLPSEPEETADGGETEPSAGSESANPDSAPIEGAGESPQPLDANSPARLES